MSTTLFSSGALATALGLPGDIANDRALSELGVDSLTSIEVAAAFHDLTGQELRDFPGRMTLKDIYDGYLTIAIDQGARHHR